MKNRVNYCGMFSFIPRLQRFYSDLYYKIFSVHKHNNYSRTMFTTPLLFSSSVEESSVELKISLFLKKRFRVRKQYIASIFRT